MLNIKINFLYDTTRLIGLNSKKDHPLLSVPAMQRLGYIPVLSTLTGSVRVVAALATMFFHSYHVGFPSDDVLRDSEKKDDDIECLYKSGWHFWRGVCELVPVGGNIVLIALDVISTKKTMQDEFDQRFSDQKEVWTYGNVLKATLFGELRQRKDTPVQIIQA